MLDNEPLLISIISVAIRHINARKETIPEIPCQYPNCSFVGDDASEAITIVMFNSHLLSHQVTSQQQDCPVRQKPPITRLTVKQDIDEEERVTFVEEWNRFKRCTTIPESSVADQLFQCCERSLGLLLIKENQEMISEVEERLLKAIKHSYCHKCAPKQLVTVQARCWRIIP